MQILKKGSIVIVRFHPGFGSELKRFRPVVVVSEYVQKRDERFVLIAPLTTSLTDPNFECELLLAEYDCLDQNSLLLSWYLWTIDVGRVEMRVGELRPEDALRMDEQLRRVLG